MNGISHLVWDWNGTLFADNRALIEATLEAFAAAGFPVTRTLYRQHHTKAVNVFFERLAGRTLTAAEHERLLGDFRRRYTGYLGRTELAPDAAAALSRWQRTGRSQSLLSLYDHGKLLRLTAEKGIAEFFVLIDGAREPGPGRKAPRLARHLGRLGVDPAEVLLIGDSVDDAVAAEECGARCVLYDAGEDALHTRESLDARSVPVVAGLGEAVEVALAAGRRRTIPGCAAGAGVTPGRSVRGSRSSPGRS
ncbi:HAD hydrolase-like protein [Amycolatopsis sp. A133]|uniref:HAD family hydrolase n=1 Tax=Amycolatopsis sp. A133 TaxID=3064472 RepID=UPI0027F96A3A|nr:HAD family hydrolase [Amycolatopsis sp. A133]MDQ7808993.1 HAD hydrolase-like protein [Amycolatopsis sp. A133]